MIPTPASVLVLCLLADTVVLKNGSQIQGEIVQQSEERIVLRFPGGTMELPRKEIETIRRESRLQYLIEEGERQLQRGSYEGSVDCFRRAVEEDPASGRAHRGLAAARIALAEELVRIGRHEDARAIYEELRAEDASSEAASRGLLAIEKMLEDARMEEERGLAELRSGDVEKGLWRLQRIYDRFPERRNRLALPMGRALVEAGNRHFESRRWADAQASYLGAMTIEPELEPLIGEPFARAIEGQALPLLARGEFAAADKLIARGLEVTPTSEALRYYRGLCLEAGGKPREAALEYLTIVDRKRPADLEGAAAELRIEAEKLLADAGKTAPLASPHSDEVLAGEFRSMKTAHFVVLHKSFALAREVALVAERSYASLLDDLRCATHLGTPLTIVLYPSEEEYRAASSATDWSVGTHWIARRLGRLSDHRILTYQGQPRLHSGILPHEIAHALLAHRLNYPERIPLWGNEGFAVSREASYFHRHLRRIVSIELARRNLIPLGELLSFEEYPPPDRVLLYYAQSLSLVEFLLSLEGLDRFVGFLRSLSREKPEIDRELRRFYDIAGVQALESRWIAWFERSGR